MMIAMDILTMRTADRDRGKALCFNNMFDYEFEKC